MTNGLKEAILSEEGLAKVLELSKAGKTQAEIAREFGVTRNTLYLWSKANPELKSVILEGRKVADERVEDSLYEQCFDRPTVEVKTEYDAQGNIIKRTETKKVIPANTTAIQYWLANRSEGKWKARQQLELIGDPRKPVVFVNDVPEVAPDEYGEDDPVRIIISEDEQGFDGSGD